MVGKYKFDFNIPQDVKDLLNKLHTKYEAYLVGGCTRDLLLDKAPKDYDITTNATPEQIKELFKDYTLVNNNGEKHGTVTVRYNNENYEITTYRLDSTYEDHRHPDKVEFTTNLEADLSRRDFTINAFVFDGKYLCDYFDGVNDIENKVIRAIGNPYTRFSEDALRILRMIRFASVLDFNIDQSTLEYAWLLRETLSYVSKERIREEINKMIVGPGFTKLATNYYVMDILSEVLPIRDMFYFDQKNPAHPWDLWTHTLHVLKYSMEQLDIKDYKLALAALFHDIAKPYTRSSEVAENGVFVRFHYPDHPQHSANLVEAWLRKYKYSTQEITYIKALVLLHDEREFADSNKVKVKLILNKLAKAINSTNKTEIKALFNYLTILKEADTKDHDYTNTKYKDIKWLDANTLQDIAKVINFNNECYLLKDLAINGNDILALGVEPGPVVKDILTSFVDDVIHERIENTKEALTEKFKREIVDKL